MPVAMPEAEIRNLQYSLDQLIKLVNSHQTSIDRLTRELEEYKKSVGKDDSLLDYKYLEKHFPGINFEAKCHAKEAIYNYLEKRLTGRLKEDSNEKPSE
jgi:hypothetical protein